MNKIREAGFHIAARKETELTREIAEQFYKDQKDKEYFSDLTDHMSRSVLSSFSATDHSNSVGREIFLSESSYTECSLDVF